MLVDTDVLIWHLRGHPNATRRLDELDTLTLSAVSYLEILQGMRNEAELLAVQKMLQKRSATLLPITETIYDPIGGEVSTSMTLCLEDDIDAHLGVHAESAQRSKSCIAAEAIRAYVENNEWQLREIQTAIKEAEAGDFASDAEVDAFKRRFE